ncbi:MAG: methionyl-tRNA formyltransferase [Planctomycetes bacterium]|nr:methionyl-tRNA formyltransferase [Planctomycetota bacterium]
MKILFLGSGPFGVPALERLAALARGDVEVATLPDAPGRRGGAARATPIKERGRALGLPLHEAATLAEPKGSALLGEARADLVITADIRLILPRSFLALPPRGCFNLHGSLLPLYRGAAPVARAILAGDFRFGVTLYRMVAKIDAGPIVAQSEYAPREKRDAPAVEAVLAGKAADLLTAWLPALSDGSAPAVEQDHARATYAPKLAKEEGEISWTRSAEAIENHVLALRPWPGSFGTLLRARARSDDAPLVVVVHEARRLAGTQASATAFSPGTIRAVSYAGIDVACGEQGAETVRILALQRAGGRAMTAAEFLRGCPLESGDRFAEERAIAGEDAGNGDA